MAHRGGSRSRGTARVSIGESALRFASLAGSRVVPRRHRIEASRGGRPHHRVGLRLLHHAEWPPRGDGVLHAPHPALHLGCIPASATPAPAPPGSRRWASADRIHGLHHVGRRQPRTSVSCAGGSPRTARRATARDLPRLLRVAIDEGVDPWASSGTCQARRAAPRRGLPPGSTSAGSRSRPGRAPWACATVPSLVTGPVQTYWPLESAPRRPLRSSSGGCRRSVARRCRGRGPTRSRSWRPSRR